MDSGAKLWRVFGIPVHIDASWYVIALFLTGSLATGYFPRQHPGLFFLAYWAMGLAAALLLFGCVLLHELGHSVVARGYGIPVNRVTLFIFGGVAQLGHEAKRPWVELQVSLAGPLVSVLLAGGCILGWVVADGHWPQATVLKALLRYLASINTGIVLFNLLPGFPLDGGRVLRSLLWAITGSLRRATRIASFVGVALGVGLIVLGAYEIATRGFWSGGLWSVLLGGYLQNAAWLSYRMSAMTGGE